VSDVISFFVSFGTYREFAAGERGDHGNDSGEDSADRRGQAEALGEGVESGIEQGGGRGVRHTFRLRDRSADGVGAAAHAVCVLRAGNGAVPEQRSSFTGIAGALRLLVGDDLPGADERENN